MSRKRTDKHWGWVCGSARKNVKSEGGSMFFLLLHLLQGLSLCRGPWRWVLGEGVSGSLGVRMGVRNFRRVSSEAKG